MKKLSIIISSAALLISASNAIASTNKNVYFLKGAPITGSRIATTDAKSNIPFNKSYQELSQQQRQQVNAKFNNLGINDTPPFPKKGLSAVYKPLIKANKAFGLNQKISINATISRNGLVDKVDVLNNSDAEFTDYLQQALRNIKFEPAKCGATTCEMTFPINIEFN